MVVVLAMGLAHSAWAVAALPAALLIASRFAGPGWPPPRSCELAALRVHHAGDAAHVSCSPPRSTRSASTPRPIQIVVECTPLYQGVTLVRALTLGAVGPGLLWYAAYLALMGLTGCTSGPPHQQLLARRARDVSSPGRGIPAEEGLSLFVALWSTISK